MNMAEAEFWETTMHAFNTRLKGWREARAAEDVKQARLFRDMYAWQIMGIPWPQDRMPDIYKLMPLPGDPKPKQVAIEDTADKARRRYNVKKMRPNVSFNDEIEALIRQHYQPDWGTHPDELVPADTN